MIKLQITNEKLQKSSKMALKKADLSKGRNKSKRKQKVRSKAVKVSAYILLLSDVDTRGLSDENLYDFYIRASLCGI